MLKLSAAVTENLLLMLIVSVALIGGGMTSCAKPEDPQTLISDARRYDEKGDHKAAIIQLKNALQKNPDDPEARYLLGIIYNKTGDSQSAEKELRKALSLGMSAAKVLPDLGRTLLGLGQFQQVLDETKQLSEDKNSVEILTLKGSALLGLGKVEEAQDLFNQALKDKPDFSDALIGLAKYSLLKRDIEAAMQYSEQAVTGNPQDAGAWLFKGDLLRAQGEDGPALAAYDQVVKLKPDSASAYINKAFIEIDKKEFEAAKANIEAARKASHGNLVVFYSQALLDFNQGKPAVALESLQQVLRSYPDHMPSLLLRSEERRVG